MHYLSRGRWSLDNISQGFSGITMVSLVQWGQIRRREVLETTSFPDLSGYPPTGKGFSSAGVIHSQIQWDELKASLTASRRRWLLGGEMAHHPKPTAQVLTSVLLLRSSVCLGKSLSGPQLNSLWSRDDHVTLSSFVEDQCYRFMMSGLLHLGEVWGQGWCLGSNLLCICPCQVCAKWLHL